jgi:hypothetical protein
MAMMLEIVEVPTYVSDDEMDTSDTIDNGKKKSVKKRQRNWVEAMVFNNTEEAEEAVIKENQWSYHYTNTTTVGKRSFLDVIKSKLVVNNVMLVFVCYLILQMIRLFYYIPHQTILMIAYKKSLQEYQMK